MQHISLYLFSADEICVCEFSQYSRFLCFSWPSSANERCYNVCLFAQVYRESVPQDLRPGSEVMRISATDIDDGNNSIVAYELHTLREDERGYFRVDRATGVITLNRTIDVSTKLQFNPFQQV
jgi:hypothetical protein